MARYFLDASALVKRYHHESGTRAVERLFHEPGNQLFISRLALVELHSTFARLVREGVLTEGDFGKLTDRLEAEVAAGALNVAAVSNQRLEAAAWLLRKQGLTHTMRTLDAIHLATAQALDDRSRIAVVAADKNLLAVAAACGLAVLDVG